MKRETYLAALAPLLITLLLASAIHAYDLAIWFLEVTPILIAFPIMVATYRRFPLTPLVYALMFVHALVLMLGGHYSYARVPLGFWIEDVLSLHRNPYDKIGHFMVGFVPFLVAREVLLRGRYLTDRRMTAFLAICVVMAASAWFEVIEWWAALALGQSADRFIGAQGDPWDTQSDMLFAAIGAAVSMLTLSRVHDRQMARMKP